MEQTRRLRSDFLAAAAEADSSDDDAQGGNGLLELSRGPRRVVESCSEESDSDTRAAQQRMEEYFKDKDDDNERFLKNYILSEQWRDDSFAAAQARDWAGGEHACGPTALHISSCAHGLVV